MTAAYRTSPIHLCAHGPYQGGIKPRRAMAGNRSRRGAARAMQLGGTRLAQHLCRVGGADASAGEDLDAASRVLDECVQALAAQFECSTFSGRRPGANARAQNAGDAQVDEGVAGLEGIGGEVKGAVEDGFDAAADRQQIAACTGRNMARRGLNAKDDAKCAGIDGSLGLALHGEDFRRAHAKVALSRADHGHDGDRTGRDNSADERGWRGEPLGVQIGDQFKPVGTLLARSDGIFE